jgi:hypothetical protein
VAHAESEIIKFECLRLLLEFLIYLVGTGQFLKPEEAFPSPVKKSESFILTE